MLQLQLDFLGSIAWDPSYTYYYRIVELTLELILLQLPIIVAPTGI